MKDNILSQLLLKCPFPEVFEDTETIEGCSFPEPRRKIGHIRADYDGWRWYNTVWPCHRALATQEICKEIVRCGGLDGRVNIALDYFDASINRNSAWTVGFRNVQKALLSALLTPNDALRALQDEQRFSEQMERQEAMKTMTFGMVWDEYCRSCNVPVGTDWFETVQKYEHDVLSKRL